MSEVQEIKLDRMRYTKNTTSSRLALLAIVFDVLFFISIYKSNVGTWYYNILMGASIIYNLVFMLAAFLSSESVKSYKAEYSYVMIILGVLQIVRIWIYPMTAHAAVVNNEPVMGDAQFIRCIIYLTGSAVCLIVAGIINARKASSLKRHIREQEKEA